MLQKICDLAAPGDWWVLSGSLPPGVPTDFYATIIEVLKQSGAYTVLDTSGPALRSGCRAQPYMVKPNQIEAGELTGLSTESPEQLVEAARRILDFGIRYVAISLGEAGALLATEKHVWMAQPPRIEERNPIGAGDSMVAGMVWALKQGKEPPEVLAAGVPAEQPQPAWMVRPWGRGNWSRR